MNVTYIGVRHHSPACAKLVKRTIEEQRPAYVLVEGPADVNDRIGELLLGHRLPIAIFSHHRVSSHGAGQHGVSRQGVGRHGAGRHGVETRAHLSWTPFCDYSPEWVALNAGRACGAELRFIDLPGWHPALAGRSNRYADAERRYADAAERLCRAFAVDNVDALWDRLVEVEPGDGLAERLERYFDLVRGDAAAGEDDAAREDYMAGWIRAAAAEGPVVVVTGGFHTPALRTLAASGPSAWPEIPRSPEGPAGSFLVPYSFRRLDSFSGYQSGMPSPGYYQRLWEDGPAAAGDGLVETVATRLRRRGQPVSTADLIAARTLAEGLARLRGHPCPARTDILDGLVSALVADDLERPPPWSRRAPLAPGTHPVVVEMVAALSGDRVGRLHPDTPAPPLVHDVAAELERLGLLDRGGVVDLSLTDPGDLLRSRALHRLRVLGVPGAGRISGPATGADPVLDERWELSGGAARDTALIEAGAYGATLADAATAALAERIAAAGSRVDGLAGVLFDAALCGITDVSEEVIALIADCLADAREPGPLGEVLATVLGLWRHDRVLGAAGSAAFGAVIDGAVTRVLWLAEGVQGGPAPADLARVAALAAVRDALLHAAELLTIGRAAALDVARRIAADPAAPPDLRGAAFGMGWSLGEPADPARALRGAAHPHVLGDWLAGLFVLAREPAREPAMLGLLDEVVGAMSEHDFLVALPALRQAFEFFPPREREAIARGLLDLQEVAGSARSLLRTRADPLLIAEARAMEERAGRLLAEEGLR